MAMAMELTWINTRSGTNTWSSATKTLSWQPFMRKPNHFSESTNPIKTRKPTHALRFSVWLDVYPLNKKISRPMEPATFLGYDAGSEVPSQEVSGSMGVGFDSAARLQVQDHPNQRGFISKKGNPLHPLVYLLCSQCVLVDRFVNYIAVSVVGTPCRDDVQTHSKCLSDTGIPSPSNG